MRILVTGAGGFIGYHLSMRLAALGHLVTGIDVKYPQFVENNLQNFDSFKLIDLRNSLQVDRFCSGEAQVPPQRIYHLAADMGGIEYISNPFNRATITRNNTQIDLNVLELARKFRVGRFFYSSSACVYRQDIQSFETTKGLAESDAWPADPEPGYGLQKLFTEKLCEYYRDEFDLPVRVARFHNCFGPVGTYEGGREKAPAALCRKVAKALDGDEIAVYGDGKQIRSFIYIDDLVDGILRLTDSDYSEPLNLGTDRAVEINALAEIAIAASGKKLTVKNIPGPQGVRSRNSDNTEAKAVLGGWEPQVTLEEGMQRTYNWIKGEIDAAADRSKA